MNWFILTLLPPAINAAINHIDKYLLDKYMKKRGIGALVIFSSIIGMPVAAIIAFLNPDVFSIQPKFAVLTLFSGIIYASWVLPYFYALEKDEASVVSPLFQLSSIITYIFGTIFLKETLSESQIIGSVFILGGSIGLTLNLSNIKKIGFKFEVFYLMLLGSFFIALNSLIFKYVALKESFWVTSFWQYLGFVLFALVLLVFVKSYQKQFIKVFQENKAYVLSLNIINEVLAISAKIILDFATLLAPLAVVYFMSEGIQPFFVLSYGVILTKFFPGVAKEKISRKYMIQKALSILLIFLGSAFLYKN